MGTTVPIATLGDIPAFNASGVLPPFIGSPTQTGNSPYETTLVKLVDRFATSTERKDILSGYLAHRAALLALGVSGLQWLDGSFLEDVETQQSRPPGDIDVVTFTWRPAGMRKNQNAWDALVTANLDLFDPAQSKAQFKTDAYFIDVHFGPSYLIERTSYWLSLFSHRRVSSLWKGMLSIPLNSQQDDTAASQLLATK